MKIGIMTYWESNDNYGQQLQCWALQRYLVQLGHEPFLIRFRRYVQPVQAPEPARHRKSARERVWQTMVRLLRICLLFPYLSDRRRRHEKKRQQRLAQEESLYYARRTAERRFADFRREHIVSLAEDYPTLESLVQNPPVADAYITGSDQVWNYDLQPGELAAYFLQFGNEPVRRIAYAPSIGHAIWPETLKPLLKDYLKAFDALSVREASSIGICRSVGFDAQLVLDPTMLLTVDAYRQIMSEPVTSDPFVFIYSMNYQSLDDLPWAGIRQWAESKAFDICVTPGNGYCPGREIFPDVIYDYATIPAWLRRIQQSQAVIAASFHGIVFAILLHRPFVFTPLQGAFSQSNIRVTGLLSLLGLEDRIWDTGNDFTQIMSRDIAWDRVDAILDQQRILSGRFLINSLS